MANSPQESQSSNDAYLIKVIRAFFELNDVNLSCNDMLTKIFRYFTKSIERGAFEETINEFLAYIGSTNGCSSSKPKKSRRKDMSYHNFKSIIACLITRFATTETLKDILDSNADLGPSNSPPISYNMHGMRLNMFKDTSHTGINLIMPRKKPVIEPKQAALLVFLFNLYYTYNTAIQPAELYNFIETLDNIAKAKFGSVEVDNDDTMPSLLSKYGGDNLVLLEKYKNGSYSEIFAMLNQCFLRYDFLSTERSGSSSISKNKLLLEHYCSAIMNISDANMEDEIWSWYVNQFGIVTNLADMYECNAVSQEFAACVILTSLNLLDSPSKVMQQSYVEQWRTKAAEATKHVSNRKYTNSHPYNLGVTRDPGSTVIKSEAKITMLNHMLTILDA
uniref:U23-like protein n=1 Tax=Glypta fumiferanae TaxID=389681 RepID=A0A0F6QA86_9HYME|nr:U23-like protein [Glypta fumiferanae]